MDQARRIKALTTLQRIKEHELDEQAQQMGLIRSEQARIQSELDALQHKVETEAHITTPEAAPFLAGFLQAIESQRNHLQKEMEVLDKKAAQIEGRLLGKYKDARTNEDVLNKTIAEKKRDDDLAEAGALEEIARNRYMRQMKDSENR